MNRQTKRCKNISSTYLLSTMFETIIVTLETKKIERTFRNNFFSKKFFELLNTLQSPCASCMCVVQNSTRYINSLLSPENISHNKKKPKKLQSVTECTKHLRKLSLLANYAYYLVKETIVSVHFKIILQQNYQLGIYTSFSSKSNNSEIRILNYL